MTEAFIFTLVVLLLVIVTFGVIWFKQDQRRQREAGSQRYHSALAGLRSGARKEIPPWYSSESSTTHVDNYMPTPTGDCDSSSHASNSCSASNSSNCCATSGGSNSCSSSSSCSGGSSCGGGGGD